MARLPCPPAPFTDETLSSWVQRLACTYHLNVMDFLAWIGGANIDDEDLDLDIAPPDEFVRLLGLCTGESIERILGMTATRADTVLEKRYRNAFCPFCWDEDIDGGTAPYVRLAWIDAWCVHCSRHQCNLVSVAPRFEASRLPFMGTIWSNDIEWAKASRIPFTRRFIQTHIDSHEDFRERLRRELIDPMQTRFPHAQTHELLWGDTRQWFRYVFDLRNGKRAVFRGVSTPLSVVSDLIFFCGYRFGGGDPLFASASSKRPAYGWTEAETSYAPESQREPQGSLRLRLGSFIFAYVFWEVLVKARTAHNLATFVREWIPLPETKSENAWLDKRIQVWPPGWQLAWGDLLKDVEARRQRASVRRKR